MTAARTTTTGTIARTTATEITTGNTMKFLALLYAICVCLCIGCGSPPSQPAPCPCDDKCPSDKCDDKCPCPEPSPNDGKKTPPKDRRRP